MAQGSNQKTEKNETLDEGSSVDGVTEGVGTSFMGKAIMALMIWYTLAWFWM